MTLIQLRQTITSFLIAFVVWSGTLYAQPSTLLKKDIIFDQLPTELGLSQNMINCIIQDHEGFLWIATWGGLIRYDGYSTIVYHSGKEAGKIKSDKITTLYEDRNGFLWIGTQMEGLFRFDKNTEKFTQYKHNPLDKKSLSNNNVWCIQEDGLKNLWVGTENGLNVFDSKQETFNACYNDLENPKSLSSSHIRDLFKSSDNTLWIATTKGLNRLEVNHNTPYTFKKYYYNDNTSASSQEEHNYVYKVREINLKGTSSIWFSTSMGLKKLQNEKIQNFSIKGKPKSYYSMFSLLVVEGAHPFILTGSERGLNFFDPITNTFTRLLSVFDEQSNLSHGSVTALFLDRGGILWVGTKKGLNKADSYSKNFGAYKTSSFDKTRSTITGIQGSSKEGYLISTLGGGLYRFKDEKFQHIRIGTARENDYLNFIQVLYKAQDESIWLGTVGNGIYHFNQEDIDKSSGLLHRFNHFNMSSTPALNDDFPMSITQDRYGNVWVGGWHGGLNKIKPNGEVTIFSDSVLQNLPVLTIYADHDGTVWLGTNGNGLYMVTRKGEAGIDIQHIDNTDQPNKSLTNNFINAIYEDHNGLLWIGTQGGLHSFDRNTRDFKFFNVKNSPGTKIITNVLEDNNGKLWVSHGGGLTAFNPSDTLHSNLYNYHDRIQGGFFFNNAAFKDDKGRLFFGGAEGFNIIDQTTTVENASIPRAAIVDFKIFGKSVPYGSEVQGRTILHEPISKTKQISLKAKENSISFEFTALDYSAPEKIQYAYMLEGFDPDWIYTNAERRYAVYTNLSEGKYTFKVKAANSEGRWSDHVSQIQVIIDPPWWKTNWARLVYFITVIITLYIFKKFILMRANFRHDLKVERLQRENMEKLNQTKLQFFTNVSHEFRTPLTLILGPLQDLIDNKERDKEERDKLVSVSNNANRLLRLANQLLDFRKVESGNLKLQVSEANIVKFIREIKLSFDPLAANLKIDFSLTTSSNNILVWFDPDQFEKIMFNLLSNAFKHTPSGGKIMLQISEENESVKIVVEDNGKGIKQEHFENIFQTFFSYEEDKHHNGTGIGLALAKSLVDSHQGQLDFESQEHVFTRFIIKLRQGSAHFDSSELSPISGDIESMDHYPSLAPNTISFEEEIENEPVTNDHPTLLIVEDNDEVRAYIKSIFKDSYGIMEASDGQKGLLLAIDKTPDLIISDVMMPEVDGITLCAELKSNIKTSHIPVVLLTARTSLIFKREGLETGADDYITKPFNPQLLKLKVRNLVHTREVIKKIFQDNKILIVEPSKVSLTSIDELFLKQALEGVERNMNNPNYGVEELCKDVGMGRSQLYKKLKGLTGQSGNEFIRTLRLKRAAQLLEQNQFTIAEVTNWVGFTDLQYFRDCFKKLFGVIPSEYIKINSLKSPKKENSDINF